MREFSSASVAVTRLQNNVLARAERRLLDWLCARMPAWVTPDGLTLLALVSAVLVFVAYAMSNIAHGWLWLAVAGYVGHWFGDSLDGSLARYRGTERPRYGYFIDHSCDGIAILLILGGIGSSPFVRVDVALLAVAGYLLLAVHTFLLAKIQGEFQLSHGGLGPTEIRLILIAITLAMFADGRATMAFPAFSVFDLLVIAASIMMFAVFLVETWRKARLLLAGDTLRG